MKKYLVCETSTAVRGFYRIHGKYDSWFKAAWKLLCLSFTFAPRPGKGMLYIQTREEY